MKRLLGRLLYTICGVAYGALMFALLPPTHPLLHLAILIGGFIVGYVIVCAICVTLAKTNDTLYPDNEYYDCGPKEEE